MPGVWPARLEDVLPLLSRFDRLCIEADVEPDVLRRYLEREIENRRRELATTPVVDARPKGPVAKRAI